MSALTRLCMEFFETLTMFQSLKPEERPDYDQLRTKIEGLLEKQRKGSAEVGVSHDVLEEVQFAQAALMDEVVLNSDWEYRREWQANLLQNYYFKTHTAGVDFFRRMAGLGPNQEDALEIYYYCLALGFRGELEANPERIAALRAEVLQRLPHLDPASGEHIAPEGDMSQLHGDFIGTTYFGGRMPILWFGIPLLLVFILYFIYLFLFNRQEQWFLSLPGF